jgi:hypothetical protein
MITTTAVEVGVVLAVNRAEHRVGETTERTATENNGDDDDDSALDESEQTLRPADVAINQQRVQAWHPILDPVWVIVALFYLGIILIPVGTCFVKKRVLEGSISDAAGGSFCRFSLTLSF